MIRFFIAILIALCSFSAFSQNFRFNEYSVESGFSQNFVYSLNQDKYGYLWVGTGEGLSKFDGRKFSLFTKKDGLSENVITSSYEAPNNFMWFGHIEGSLTYFDGKEFQAIPAIDGLDSPVNAITGAGNTCFFVSQNNGVYRSTTKGISKIGDFDYSLFQSLGCFSEKELIVGTQSGLMHLTEKNGKWSEKGTYLQGKNIVDIQPSKSEKDVFIVLVETGEIFKARSKDGKIQFRAWELGFDPNQYSFKTILEDKSGNLWVGTYGAGMIKLPVKEGVGATFFNESNGMSSAFVQSLLQDREGNIWIGSFGAGLSTLIDDYFTFYETESEAQGSGVYAFISEGVDHWYGTEFGLVRKGPNAIGGEEFYTDTNGLVKDKVTALYYKDSILWIGTAASGLYKFNYKDRGLTKEPWEYGLLGDNINGIILKNNTLWVATNNGLIMRDLSTSTTTVLNTSFGLAHNSIHCLYEAENGSIWIGTKSRFLYEIVNGEFKEHEFAGRGEADVISISEDFVGNIWFATSENGVFRYNGEIFKNITSALGLASDYCYAISKEDYGAIWVGHRGALSKIFVESEEIQTFDHKAGIKDQVSKNTMYLDHVNQLWIGTGSGLIAYDASKDLENNVAPTINILKVTIGEKSYALGERITLPYGHYRIQFEYVGVSFKHPEKVRYQYKLVGHDEIFSDPTAEASKTYGRITDGVYVFEVVACNEDGFCSEVPAQFQITIRAPIWKKWWFYFLLAILVLGIVYFAIRLRVKRLKETQANLEEQLEIKTKEVVEKADKIEEINKDLMDSINYAERIQTSILPDEKAITDLFPNSFIFFKPRDIVSGDFYFIKKIENKLIVCCADCTGHGVPGAFMSMVGSVLLKNIYENAFVVWKKPNEVLEILDQEVHALLHQKAAENPEDDFFTSKDGMDLTLCEIDLDTNKVLISSAMRTSLVFNGNGLDVIRGTKRSIGGDNLLKVEFDLEELEMKPGQALYLFSDGYTDQFGGPDGRKLKISGTKQVILNSRDQEIANQRGSIESNFNLWQADYPQIDDVLMIGIMF